MGIANKFIPHYTFEDWQHWEGKWELIDGHPIAMSPTPVPEHQRVAAEITTEFVIALRKANCRKCNVYQPTDYKISDDTILIPDLLIVCGEIKKKFLDFPPALVVEILSPSTALRDRNTKFQLYEQQGVKYYLMVDIDKKEIECYKLLENKFKLLSSLEDHELELADNCSISADLKNIF